MMVNEGVWMSTATSQPTNHKSNDPTYSYLLLLPPPAPTCFSHSATPRTRSESQAVLWTTPRFEVHDELLYHGGGNGVRALLGAASTVIHGPVPSSATGAWGALVGCRGWLFILYAKGNCYVHFPPRRGLRGIRSRHSPVRAPLL